jgi:hypothetical protein
MLVLAREFAVTGLRLVAVEGGRVIAAGWSGKVKTTASIIAICFMLTAWHDLPLIKPWLTLDVLGTAVIVVTTLWSAWNTSLKNRGCIQPLTPWKKACNIIEHNKISAVKGRSSIPAGPTERPRQGLGAEPVRRIGNAPRSQRERKCPLVLPR